MINSDVIWLTTTNSSSREDIEDQLTKDYGNLIRWAIIDKQDNKLKICLSYEKAGS